MHGWQLISTTFSSLENVHTQYEISTINEPKYFYALICFLRYSGWLDQANLHLFSFLRGYFVDAEYFGISTGEAGALCSVPFSTFFLERLVGPQKLSFHHYEAKLCILCIVSGFRNKDAPFALLLFFHFLWSFRQNFNMFKDSSMYSKNIQTQNCVLIQCTVWPRNVFAISG